MAAVLGAPYGLGAPPGPASIEIPMKDSDEVVEVMLHELPQDAGEIVEILKTEEAPLPLWRAFAIEYYKRAQHEAFYLILLEAIKLFQNSRTGTSTQQAQDRIAILMCLAAYHVTMAAREKDPSNRQEHYNKATVRVNEAENILIDSPTTWLVKGMLFFVKGDPIRAGYQFNSVLNQAPDNVPALLGKACIEFNNKEYKNALKLYKRALRVLPYNTPQIRLGIGLCYHQLGQETLARAAYERCLQMDPNNVQALVGLGMLDINDGGADKIPAGMQRLRRAYEIDQTHAIVLNQLAHHFFYREDYAKVENLAMNAYHSSEVEAIKADSCLIVARAYHAQNNYEQAYTYYLQATKLAPAFILAHYGLGQMLLYRGELDAACECFEKVLASEPSNYEALKIMGSICGRLPGKRGKGIQYLRQVVQLRKDDVEAWLELAEFLEGSSYAESLAAYEKAAKIWQDQIELPFPPEVHNNIGALLHKLGRHADARTQYAKAMEQCQLQAEQSADLDEKTNLENLRLTVMYNEARLMEDTQHVGDAEETYKKIIEIQPGYVDAHLRLGMIAEKSGQHVAASEHFKEVLNFDQDNPDPRTLLGVGYAANSEYGPARKAFEGVLARAPVASAPQTSAGELAPTTSSGQIPTYGGKHDVYAMVSLGNVMHRLTKRESDPAKQTDFAKRALDCFSRALNLNQRNAFAAHGIAILLAERGYHKEARDIFMQVREAANDNPDIWINLGHVYFELEQFSEAIKNYETALKRLQQNNDVTTMLYLARVHFVLGKTEKNATALLTSKRYLEKAMHMRPWDMSIRFNLALTEQETAVVFGNTLPSRRSLDQVVQAQNMVERSRRTFEFLKSTEPYPPKAYEQQMAAARENYGNTLVPFLAKQLTIQAKADEENAKKMDALMERSEALKKADVSVTHDLFHELLYHGSIPQALAEDYTTKSTIATLIKYNLLKPLPAGGCGFYSTAVQAFFADEFQREAVERETKKKNEDAKRAAEEDKRRLEELYKTFVATDAKGKRGRKRADEDDGVVEDAGQDSDEGGGEEKPKKKRGPRKSRSKGSGGEDEEARPAKRRSRKARADDSDDDDAGKGSGADEEDVRAVKKRGRKSRSKGSGGEDDEPRSAKKRSRKARADDSDDDEAAKGGSDPEEDDAPKRRSRLKKKTAARQMDDEIDDDDLHIDESAGASSEAAAATAADSETAANDDGSAGDDDE